jgi:sec-independent protein translocase protein TatA
MLLLPTVGPAEIAIIGIVVVLLFGVGKLSGLGKDLGGSIKEFRRAMKEDDEPEAPAQVAAVPAAQPVATATVEAPQQAAAPVNPEQPREDNGPRPNVF